MFIIAGKVLDFETKSNNFLTLIFEIIALIFMIKVEGGALFFILFFNFFV